VSAAGTPTDEVVHRGVRWRRSPSGRTLWFNEGLSRWVLWEPGSDAPPLPPSWEPDEPVPDEPVATGGAPPTDAMSTRAPMRSPYRLIPLVIAVIIVALAFWDATRPPGHATKADIAAAEALKGQCLVKEGGKPSFPLLSPTPVSCSSAKAFAKVVAVMVPGHPGSCPLGSVVVQVLQTGVVGEPSECLLAVRH
jgi:hypothetical protein